MRRKIMFLATALIMSSQASVAGAQSCQSSDQPVAYLDCLDQLGLFPSGRESPLQIAEKVELIEDHPELANAQCLPAAMISVQAFRDCLGRHLGFAESSSESNSELALIQCFGMTNPQQFRDCAFGHLPIRL